VLVIVLFVSGGVSVGVCGGDSVVCQWCQWWC